MIFKENGVTILQQLKPIKYEKITKNEIQTLKLTKTQLN